MRAGAALRFASGVAGVGLLGAAAAYVSVRHAEIRPTVWISWWVTAALVHDLVVAPLAIAVGWVVVRLAPRAVKAPLQAGLLLSAVLAAMAWPALRGYGRVPSNPTYLPRSYGTGLALSLGVVWALCGMWALARLVRRRRGSAVRATGPTGTDQATR